MKKTPTPQRQLGRVKHSDWLALKLAARKSGESFTRWAVSHLLAAAKRERLANLGHKDDE